MPDAEAMDPPKRSPKKLASADPWPAQKTRSLKRNQATTALTNTATEKEMTEVLYRNGAEMSGNDGQSDYH
jgi:hypothetical protein